MPLTLIAVGAAIMAFSGPVITSPVWTRAPSFADVAAAYPARARGVDGSATLFCRFDSSGALDQCRVARETPRGLGFGEAAKSLAGKFTLSVDPSWAMGSDRFGVEVPIKLMDPNTLAMRDRLISRPVWTTSLTPAAVSTFFPLAATDKGLATGRGVAECKVEAEGALKDCRPVSAEPEGVGFAEAAAKAASGMKMSPWTSDGGPVDGAIVRIPIRLMVEETQPDATSRFVWRHTPTGEDMLRAFPRAALSRNLSGQADLRCQVQQDGAIDRCSVVGEQPAGWGFGAAARSLAPMYRVSMRDPGHPAPLSWISVSVPMGTMSH